MKQLTDEKMLDNYERFMQVVNDTFEGEKLTSIVNMMDDFEVRFSTAPASSFEHLHSAYNGGLCEHTLRVYDIAMDLYELWEKHGAVMGYTKAELIFSVLFHDLGKAGDIENDYYTPQDSEWHRANRGQIFKMNEKCEPIPHQDLALFLLQHYNVKLTTNEWISIKIHEGMFFEDNKSYFINWDAHKKLRTHMPYLVHQADMMATQIEFEDWRHGEQDEDVVAPVKKSGKTKSAKTLGDVFTDKPKTAVDSKLMDFDSLFTKQK